MEPPERALADLHALAGELDYRLETRSVGRVLDVGDGVVWFDGLPDAGFLEVVACVSGARALVLSLEAGRAGAIVLGPDRGIRPGERVHRTGEPLSVPAGRTTLGRVLSPIGLPLDGHPAPEGERRPVEARAPRLIERRPVGEPLRTGTKAIDWLFPIGRGQRELIVGDRNTGKSTLAIDAVLAQQGQGVRCVYACIGQKGSFAAKLLARLEAAGALAYTTVVLASSADPPALRYLAPYAACAIAEAERDAGGHALVVYDDLGKHAEAYRELSLLLGRSPGREAYPADIFYAHARLLERAAALTSGGSLSALPIVETLSGNLTAYIPTNLISITDGQLYLDRKLFNRGVLPAIDTGLSVSRVGSKAQSALLRQLSRGLKLELARYRDLEAYTRYGADLDPQALERLERGRRILAALKQGPHEPWREGKQIALLYALGQGRLPASLPDKPTLWADLEAATSLDAELERRLNGYV